MTLVVGTGRTGVGGFAALGLALPLVAERLDLTR